MFKLSYITGSSKQKSKASPMKTQISYVRGTRATRTGTAGDASTTAGHAPRRDLYTGRWPPTWADVDCAPHWMKMAAVKAHFFGVTRAQLLTPFFYRIRGHFTGMRGQYRTRARARVGIRAGGGGRGGTRGRSGTKERAGGRAWWRFGRAPKGRTCILWRPLTLTATWPPLQHHPVRGVSSDRCRRGQCG